MVRLPVYLFVAWLLGFGLYLLNIPKVEAPSELKQGGAVDAVVVLTGGGGRIEAGFALLGHGYGQRMLISGVNRSVTHQDLYGMHERGQELLECCTDLGREAEDTIGNSLEIAAWVRRYGFHKLAVITAEYHMPRSLALIRRQLPDRELVPVAVKSEAGPRTLAYEYNKYIFTLLRLSSKA